MRNGSNPARKHKTEEFNAHFPQKQQQNQRFLRSLQEFMLESARFVRSTADIPFQTPAQTFFKQGSRRITSRSSTIEK